MDIKKKIYFAIILGSIGFLSGFLFVLNNPSGNTSADIKSVEKWLKDFTKNEGLPSGFVLEWGDMDNVSKAVNHLTYENQKIAFGKVMMGLHPDNPQSLNLPWNAPNWEDRFKYGNKPWVVQEKYQLIWKSTWVGLLSFAVVSFSTFIFVLLLSLTWRFILHRIRELSAAIRGQ
jgi:hypothetical protein